MGEVIYGVDFRKHLGQPQDPDHVMQNLIKAIVAMIAPPVDTAPSEVNPDPDADAS